VQRLNSESQACAVLETSTAHFHLLTISPEMWSSTFLDSAGRPSFNALQNFETATLVYYVFDVMILAGKDVMNEPLSARPTCCKRGCWQSWANRSANRPNWMPACRI
jgi:hypothetical protein